MLGGFFWVRLEFNSFFLLRTLAVVFALLGEGDGFAGFWFPSPKRLFFPPLQCE